MQIVLTEEVDCADRSRCDNHSSIIVGIENRLTDNPWPAGRCFGAITEAGRLSAIYGIGIYSQLEIILISPDCELAQDVIQR